MFVRATGEKLLWRAFSSPSFWIGPNHFLNFKSNCPLTWIFCNRRASNRINKLHEGALWPAYNDYETSFSDLLAKDGLFIHPIQVARWDTNGWLPRSINLLKLSPRSQTIPPWPINELFFFPGLKETLSPTILEKLVVPTEIEYFQHGPSSSE